MACVVLAVTASLDEGESPHERAEAVRRALAAAGLSCDVQVEEHPGVGCGDCEASPAEHEQQRPRTELFRGVVSAEQEMRW